MLYSFQFSIALSASTVVLLLLSLVLLTLLILKIVFSKEKQLKKENQHLKETVEHDRKAQELLGDKIEMLQGKLAEQHEKDCEAQYLAKGLVKFSDIIGKYQNFIEELAQKMIAEIVEYTGASCGAIYLVHESDGEPDYLELKGAYGYNLNREDDSRVFPNEGYVGACFTDADEGYKVIDNVPDTYFKISSGLGEIVPKVLYLLPLKGNNIVQGVVELGLFKKLDDYKINFLQKVIENITAAVTITKINAKTSEMLELSRSQSEELKKQDEELRQYVEEITASQEDTERRQAEMEGVFGAMESSLLFAEVDLSGELVMINRNYAKVFNKTKDELQHYSFVSLLLESKISKSVVDRLMHKVSNGETIKEILCYSNGDSEYWMEQTLSPIYDIDCNILKILTIAVDITTLKQQEQKVKEFKETMVSVLDQIPGKIFVKDKDGVIILANSEVARVYNKSVDELIGTSDFDNHEHELAVEYRKTEVDIMENGTQTYVQEEQLTGDLRFLKTTKMPFYIPHLHQGGLFGFQLDVTENEVLKIENERMRRDLDRLKKHEC